MFVRIFSIPDPGSASKSLSILTQKIVSKLSKIWSGYLFSHWLVVNTLFINQSVRASELSGLLQAFWPAELIVRFASSILTCWTDCQVCFKHSDLLKRAREASIAVQSSHFQSSSTTRTADKTTPAEKEQMHLVETTTIDEPTLDEPTLEPTLNEPTLDEPDLHHGSKMDKAEEFTILPGTDGGIFWLGYFSVFTVPCAFVQLWIKNS